MDYSRYDKKTQELIERAESLVVTGDEAALDALAKLRDIASDADDDCLLGIADYYACNWYYDQLDYDNYQKHIKRSIQYFLRVNEAELLARAYSFFAADARDNDAFDVAYHYFHSALRFADEIKGPVTAGVIYANLASLYYDIEDYKLARQYYRKGYKLINNNTDDIYYDYNVMASIINDGLTLLQMGENDLAEKSYHEAQKVLERLKDIRHRELLITFKVLEARVAMVKGEEENFEFLMGKMVEALKADEDPYYLMGEIRDFCRVLIDAGRTDLALAIIDAIDERVISSGVTYAIRRLYEVKVDLYDAIGDEKKLDESLREQHRLQEIQNEERMKLYQYSTELIDLVGELQEEEARVKAENENLQLKITTDPLTGIPNRYAMDIEISKRYENAYKGNYSLGVEIMDIDGFKTYNDSYGHQAGDRCLEKVGEVLRGVCDRYDLFCARYGGDEFMMIYENMTDEEIRRISGEISEDISKSEVTVEERVIDRKVTISQGICNDIPRFKTKPWDYLSEADAALYVVKGKSMNKIRIHKLPDFTP